ncbi:hypothetical protein SLS60_011179 [Paraconiothyrium brasiliense]|uniref:Uncharacterized protein n=1 Tax=Paraconiothyrium brasiliense TaxID=300254 RepID=A0ABR3QKT5_9PLEO
MSRANTPFTDTGQDVYLTSIEHDDELYGGHREFFDGEDTRTFSSKFDGNVLDDLSLGLHDGRSGPSHSRTQSWTTTPENLPSHQIDFGEYTFDHRDAHGYPVPDELNRETTQYPPHLHTPDAVDQTGERPLPYRSSTYANRGYNPSALQNFNRTHPPAHRRSWSQNDVERLPNLAPHGYPPGVLHQPPYPHPRSQTNANPTFVRLCEPRHTRTASRVSPNSKAPPSSQGRAANKTKTTPPTSMPAGTGIPLPPDHRSILTPGNIQLTGPRMVHMSHAEQRSTSQKIIEIGAMAVLNMTSARLAADNIDPRLVLLGEGFRAREKSSAPSPEALVGNDAPTQKMLKDLVRMERMLQERGEGEEERRALEGCGYIKEVLGKMGGRDGGTGEESRDDGPPGDESGVAGAGPGSSDDGSPLTDEELMREMGVDFSSPDAGSHGL